MSRLSCVVCSLDCARDMLFSFELTVAEAIVSMIPYRGAKFVVSYLAKLISLGRVIPSPAEESVKNSHSFPTSRCGAGMTMYALRTTKKEFSHPQSR